MSFADYMVDTITYAEQTGHSGGDPVFGSQSTALARVEDTDAVVVGTARNQHKADHVLATETAITYTMRVWLPQDNAAVAAEGRRPIKIKHAREGDGSGGHYEVYF